jgi:hypothetical protein
MAAEQAKQHPIWQQGAPEREVPPEQCPPVATLAEPGLISGSTVDADKRTRLAACVTAAEASALIPGGQACACPADRVNATMKAATNSVAPRATPASPCDCIFPPPNMIRQSQQGNGIKIALISGPDIDPNQSQIGLVTP